jgi:predicted Zn-dependent peptidase
MTGSGIVLMLVLLLVSAAPAFDFSEIENKVVEHTLDNGLTLLILPRHDAPVVSFVTTVNTGCAEDPLGYMGMAHMFEHMAFKGTEEIGSKDLKAERKWMAEEDHIFNLLFEERAKGDLADSARLAELEKQLDEAADSAKQYVETNEFARIASREGGVGLNAGTSYDNTKYYLSYPSNKLELWMAMESDRFHKPVLRELYKEMQVVAEERRFRIESSPTGKLFLNEYLGLAFNSHPYGKCLIGEMSEIRNYNRPVMMERFETYYVPRNMAIGIVGDVDPKEVIKLAEEYFGRLEDKPKPPPIMIDESLPFGVRKSVIRENAQPMFIMGYRIPSVKHPDFTALEALSAHLGSGRTSVLYGELVKEKKSAVQVAAMVGFPAAKYPTLFSVYCVPSNEFTNAENEADVLAQIEKVRNEPIAEDELEKIKAKAKAAFINGLASNSGLAEQLVYYELTLGDWRELFKELDRFNALTTEDITRVAKEYLDPNKRVVAYIEKPEDGS